MIVRAKSKHLNSLCVFMSYLDARVMNANTTLIFLSLWFCVSWNVVFSEMKGFPKGGVYVLPSAGEKASSADETSPRSTLQAGITTSPPIRPGQRCHHSEALNTREDICTVSEGRV